MKKRLAMLFTLVLILTPGVLPAEESAELTVSSSTKLRTALSYTLVELEEMLDASPQLRLLSAKQAEVRNKESIWHDVSVSAGFNPIRTADKFTDRIRIGLAVSMPLDILLFRDTARVSREVEGLELHKLYGDLRRELRRLWYDREAVD